MNARLGQLTLAAATVSTVLVRCQTQGTRSNAAARQTEQRLQEALTLRAAEIEDLNAQLAARMGDLNNTKAA
jgi:hypothetical protein